MSFFSLLIMIIHFFMNSVKRLPTLFFKLFNKKSLGNFKYPTKIKTAHKSKAVLF